MNEALRKALEEARKANSDIIKQSIQFHNPIENFSKINKFPAFEAVKSIQSAFPVPVNFTSPLANLVEQYKESYANQIAEVFKTLHIGEEIFRNQIREVAKSLAPDLAHFASLVQPAILKINEVLPPFMKQVAEFAENYRVTVEKAEVLSNELEKENLFLIPYFSSFHVIRENARKIKEENKTMLEIYEDFFNDKENLNVILEHWMWNDFFKERKEIFRQCFKAHAEGDYALSIPVFYIHIEKLCKRLIGIESYCKAEVWKKKLKEAYPKEENLDGLAKMMSPDTVINFILTEIFEHVLAYPLKENSVYPNRHDVQHGDDIGYYNNKYASLRCILLLDMLSELKPIIHVTKVVS